MVTEAERKARILELIEAGIITEIGEITFRVVEEPPVPPPEAPPTWWQKHKKEVAIGLGVVVLGVAIPAILIKKKK